MTEADWLACGDVTAMLTFLEGKVSTRKLRLFGVACCERIWHLLTDSRSRKAVKTAARYADGESSDRERHEAYLAARAVVEEAEWQAGLSEVDRTPAVQAAIAARYAVGLFRSASDLSNVATATARARRAAQIRSSLARKVYNPGLWLETSASERAYQAELLRDLVGPFRLPGLELAWLTPLVVAIASSIYESREYTSLSVLADALEDAGCDRIEVLEHLRGKGPHTRGCWALDLVLGQT